MADNFRSLSPIRDQYIFVVRVVLSHDRSESLLFGFHWQMENVEENNDEGWD